MSFWGCLLSWQKLCMCMHGGAPETASSYRKAHRGLPLVDVVWRSVVEVICGFWNLWPQPTWELSSHGTYLLFDHTPRALSASVLWLGIWCWGLDLNSAGVDELVYLWLSWRDFVVTFNNFRLEVMVLLEKVEEVGEDIDDGFCSSILQVEISDQSRISVSHQHQVFITSYSFFKVMKVDSKMLSWMRTSVTGCLAYLSSCF